MHLTQFLPIVSILCYGIFVITQKSILVLLVTELQALFGFHQFLTNVCFLPQHPIQGHIALSRHISLGSLDWQYLTLPLPFMTWMVLRRTGQIFCGVFLQFEFIWCISHDWIGVVSLGKKFHKCEVLFSLHVKGYTVINLSYHRWC